MKYLRPLFKKTRRSLSMWLNKADFPSIDFCLLNMKRGQYNLWIEKQECSADSKYVDYIACETTQINETTRAISAVLTFRTGLQVDNLLVIYLIFYNFPRKPLLMMAILNFRPRYRWTYRNQGQPNSKHSWAFEIRQLTFAKCLAVKSNQLF